MTTTSISFHLRPSAKEGRHPGKLFIRIIRARQTRHISREYALYSDEWDIKNKKIIPLQNGEAADGNTGGGIRTEACSGWEIGRSQVLSHIDESMKTDLKRLREIVSRLEESGDYTASDVAERFAESLNGDTVMGYAGIVAARLRERGQERTAKAYRSAARSLTRFNDGREVSLSQIDAPLMTEYERFLIDKGLKMNTISFYLRNLRALYFRAVNEQLIPRQAVNPFSGVHTGVYQTKRRALNGDQLQTLAALESSLLRQMEALAEAETADFDAERSDALAEPGTAGSGRAAGERAAAEGQTGEQKTAERQTGERKATEARRRMSALHDALMYFFFCYHARGMSFVDMAHLKREDVGAEILTYRRRKTGGLLELKITEPMRKILSYFAERTNGSEYVFPVIDSRKTQVHRQYEAGLKRQNRSLKTLARMAGIAENLSTHVARHTWATLAKRMNFPVAVIGEALGHRDVKTTSIYLASFDRATMDELSTRLSEAAKAA